MSHFSENEYLVRRKILKVFGGSFHIYAPDGTIAGFCEMKAFKLKEDLRVFADETKTTELFRIKARSIIDFGATYDVTDSSTEKPVGALRRRGLKSMLRDEWAILGAGDEEIGTIREDSALLALVRRFLTNLIPQKYHCTIGSGSATFKQNFNPFVMKINLDYTPDLNGLLDRRLGIAAAILLCAIEGKQG